MVHRASIKLAVVLLAVFTTSTRAQTTSPAQPANSDKETVAAQGSRLASQEKKVAVEAAKPNDLEADVAAVKAENTAFREALRKMEEQQKLLLEMVDRLQRKIDGTTTTNLAVVDQPASTPVDPASTPVDTVTPPATPQDKPDEDRYRDGILIWQTKDDSRIPFSLRFTNITQFRYLNTVSANETFTDHLGVVRPVAKRNTNHSHFMG